MNTVLVPTDHFILRNASVHLTISNLKGCITSLVDVKLKWIVFSIPLFIFNLNLKEVLTLFFSQEPIAAEGKTGGLFIF